jgi:CTP synthase
VVDAMEHPVDEVTIAVVGKYVDHKDAYKSRRGAQARRHAPAHAGQPEVAGSRGRGAQGADGVLAGVDGILVPGGFGDRGFEGKVRRRSTRARAAFRTSASATACRRRWSTSRATWSGWPAPTAPRTTRPAPHPVIGLITEWRTSAGDVERRDEGSDLGGTMRLGLQEQRIKPGTLARELYGKDVVGERHRHRYEFNNRYRTQLEEAGLVISAKSMDDLLVEMVELPQCASVVRGLPGASGVPVHAARRASAVRRLHRAARAARVQGRSGQGRRRLLKEVSA